MPDITWTAAQRTAEITFLRVEADRCDDARDDARTTAADPAARPAERDFARRAITTHRANAAHYRAQADALEQGADPAELGYTA
ncbi:hypothetical protein [Embleya hyalina]|uniref:Uncharacterized protein n=1 Tax=Embleya hyalina TaxID=516124 RepID=A0A401YYS4_9ACTN|nr:hypothetical protein [Embleya hyalina]GCD99747.1 hypothetical protein EHYA_07469 [Embleya hyalina]